MFEKKKILFPKLNFDKHFSHCHWCTSKHECRIYRPFVRFSIEYTNMMNAAAFVVALILFSSSFLFFLPPTTSSCRQCVTFFWQSVGVRFLLFVYYRPSALTSGREKREKEKWAMSLFFLLHSQWTDDDDDERNEWMVNEHHSLFFSCSIWRSVQTHCRFVKQKKTICDFSLTPPIVFNDQRQTIMYKI